MSGRKGDRRTTPSRRPRVRLVEVFDITMGQGASEPLTDTPRRHGVPHPVFWVIAAALTVIATTMVVRSDKLPGGSVAWGQSVGVGGSRGVFAFSGQLSKGVHGVYMVDVDAMTIWTYEYLPQKGCLRLAAARTWRYDRYLENHNICDLPPGIVEQMVEEQRQYRLQSSESQMP